MAPGGFMDRLQATIQQKIELFRLEQRYTRRRHRRSTFVSNAVYVDGEYVYQTPNSTGSSTSSDQSGRVDALHQAEPDFRSAPTSPSTTSTPTPVKEKRLSRRISSIAGFGNSSSAAANKAQTARNDWRVSIAEMPQQHQQR